MGPPSEDNNVENMPSSTSSSNGRTQGETSSEQQGTDPNGHT